MSKRGMEKKVLSVSRDDLGISLGTVMCARQYCVLLTVTHHSNTLPLTLLPF